MEIKQISRTEQEVVFACDGALMKVVRVRDDRYPPAADDAWGEWINRDNDDIRTFIGGYLFVLFMDFYNFNEKALRHLRSDFKTLFYCENKDKEKKLCLNCQ